MQEMLPFLFLEKQGANQSEDDAIGGWGEHLHDDIDTTGLLIQTQRLLGCVIVINT